MISQYVKIAGFFFCRRRYPAVFSFYLYKRIVEPSKLNCHRQTYNQQHYAQSKRRKISPLKRPSGIPRPFLILPKSTQFHRIRDRINTVQTRQNQR